jgi:VanZ family protein
MMKLSSLRLVALLTLAVASAVLCVALQPHVPGAPPETWDKLRHAAAFGGLMLPMALCAPRLPWKTLLVLMGLGIGIEILQPYFGRDRSAYDVLADVVGLMIGMGIGRGLFALARAIRRPPHRAGVKTPT